MKKIKLTQQEISDIRNFSTTNAKFIDWYFICNEMILSEDFISEFSTHLNWVLLSYVQKLSENFILLHAEKLDWDSITLNQYLSENTLELCIDYWGNNFRNILMYQSVSKEFVLRHLDKYQTPAQRSDQRSDLINYLSHDFSDSKFMYQENFSEEGSGIRCSKCNACLNSIFSSCEGRIMRKVLG